MSAFVLMLFAFGLLAVGEIVGEDMAVRAAATQAAFAAARAPSAAAAQREGQAAAVDAVRGYHVEELVVTIEGPVTANAADRYPPHERMHQL
jgi:Flp pilus assembly protein TadG